METVGPPVDDDELHLLTEWERPRFPRPFRRCGRRFRIGPRRRRIVLSFCCPATSCRRLRSLPERAPIITPLVEPLTEFTQPTPTKGKITKEIDMAALQPRERIQMPKAAPSTTRPMAQRPAAIPSPPQPPPAALPEPPKIEAVAKEPPKIELPPTNSTVPPASAYRRKAETGPGKCRRPAASAPPAQSKVAIPNTSVAEAIRQNSRWRRRQRRTDGRRSRAPDRAAMARESICRLHPASRAVRSN